MKTTISTFHQLLCWIAFVLVVVLSKSNCHLIIPFIVKEDEDVRQYWETRNRERFAQIAAMPPTPGQAGIRAKLAAWKAQTESRSLV